MAPKNTFSINPFLRNVVLFTIAFIAVAINTNGQDSIVTLHGDSLEKVLEISLVRSPWYFYPEDISPKSLPVVNTLGWHKLPLTVFGKADPPPNWKGIGWFGLWVKADQQLTGKKLAFRINHDGASEIFVDGKMIGGYGKVGASAREMEAIRQPRELLPLWFDDTLPHLIAIRYSNFFGVYPDFLGFQATIGNYNRLYAVTKRSKLLYGYLPVSAAANFALALLHTFLFVFYRRQKLNLYYAIMVGIIGMIAVNVFLYYQAESPTVQFYAEFMCSECKVLLLWCGGLLLYAISYTRVPRYKMIVLTTVAVVYLVEYFIKFIWYPLWSINDYFSVVFLVFMGDALWGVISTIRNKRPGTWLIGIGMAAVALLYFTAWSDIFHFWPPEQNALRVFVLGMGVLIFPVCVSLYLALDFANTNKHLIEKLQEVEELSGRALKQEAEKREMITNEARKLEDTVRDRTAEIQRQADKLKEMDVVRSRFFTNITHELKTPLTLIMNPAQELLSGTGERNVSYHASLIQKNADRLLQLINQLLDISKLENGLMQVALAPVELVAFLKEHINSFAPLAIQKEIALELVADVEELWIIGDGDKLQKIVDNILSNALKFTKKGKVEVILQTNVETSGGAFVLSIKDTGKGVPLLKLPYIFERFYQADAQDARYAGGTGIGLALTRELVELLGGIISAESVEGQGTCVHVSLPFQPASPLPLTPLFQPAFLKTEEPVFLATAAGTPNHSGEEYPVVLVVEDHDELRNFIEQSLASRYRILTAGDGREALGLAQQHIPNLVITDLMVPDMDGYEVCFNLKSDERTSHIPVIMLTAKTDMESRIRGIETGADAYLGKPFVQQELLAQIENLLKLRRQLHEKYQKTGNWFHVIKELPSIDQGFLDQIRLAIQSRLDDSLFGTDQLATEIGLSRTQLHRKLKGLLGKSPGELIRIARMEHAHDLLQQKAATVSEAAYAVGFNNPASFSTSFSRHFGFPPSEVVRQET